MLFASAAAMLAAMSHGSDSRLASFLSLKTPHRMHARGGAFVGQAPVKPLQLSVARSHWWSLALRDSSLRSSATSLSCLCHSGAGCLYPLGIIRPMSRHGLTPIEQCDFVVARSSSAWSFCPAEAAQPARRHLDPVRLTHRERERMRERENMRNWIRNVVSTTADAVYLPNARRSLGKRLCVTVAGENWKWRRGKCVSAN